MATSTHTSQETTIFRGSTRVKVKLVLLLLLVVVVVVILVVEEQESFLKVCKTNG